MKQRLSAFASRKGMLSSTESHNPQNDENEDSNMMEQIRKQNLSQDADANSIV